MESITNLFNLDITYIIIGIFIIIYGLLSIIDVIGKFSVYIGKPVRWKQNIDADHKLLIETGRKLTCLTETVDKISNTLSEMERKNNETEIKKLKDSLIRYYNEYKNIGEWSELEKDAFWDLFDDYEKRGGDGYIHTIVEPIMRGLIEIDK
ncbi:MAG: hypothetical protein HFH14_08615 [Lachnospiraceae bacterium]|nr:hypothetical protein [Lachnospiraceae bacterium]